MRSDGERKSDGHAGGVVLDCGVEKLLSFREGYNLIKLTFDLILAHAQYCAVEKNVFSPGKFRMKAGAHFQQTAYPATQGKPAGGGPGYA